MLIVPQTKTWAPLMKEYAGKLPERKVDVAKEEEGSSFRNETGSRSGQTEMVDVLLGDER